MKFNNQDQAQSHAIGHRQAKKYLIHLLVPGLPSRNMDKKYFFFTAGTKFRYDFLQRRKLKHQQQTDWCMNLSI